MAIPSIAGTPALTTDGAGGTSVVVAAPSGIIAGELGIIISVNEATNQTTDTFNTPTGWTKIVGATPSNTNIDCQGMSYWRELTGDSGDDAPTVTWTGAGDNISWYMRITDADVSDPINGVGSDAQAGGPNLSIPGLTTDAANCLAFYYMVHDDDGTPFSPDGSWVEQDDQAVGASISASFGTLDHASASATGTVVISGSGSDGKIGVQFAINEAAGGPVSKANTLPLLGVA